MSSCCDRELGSCFNDNDTSWKLEGEITLLNQNQHWVLPSVTTVYKTAFTNMLPLFEYLYIKQPTWKF